jgi:SAM-dependent methyltransferase
MPKLDLHPFVNPPHNAHYEGEYSERMIRWRAVCAVDKAANLAALLGDRARGIETVLEVGCGTGAVLLEVARRGIGTSHVGFDLADPGAHAHPGVIDAGIELRPFDGRHIPLPDASVDLVYASHVLEHVPDERGFLAELALVAKRWIYIEVPCEITWRTSVRRLQTSLNIGHINAYTPETFALTLATAGLPPADVQIFDHSMEVHGFEGGRAKALAKAGVRRGLLRLSPSAASKLACYHVGALCAAPATADAG